MSLAQFVGLAISMFFALVTNMGFAMVVILLLAIGITDVAQYTVNYIESRHARVQKYVQDESNKNGLIYVRVFRNGTPAKMHVVGSYYGNRVRPTYSTSVYGVSWYSASPQAIRVYLHLIAVAREPVVLLVDKTAVRFGVNTLFGEVEEWVIATFSSSRAALTWNPGPHGWYLHPDRTHEVALLDSNYIQDFRYYCDTQGINPRVRSVA